MNAKKAIRPLISREYLIYCGSWWGLNISRIRSVRMENRRMNNSIHASSFARRYSDSDNASTGLARLSNRDIKLSFMLFSKILDCLVSTPGCQKTIINNYALKVYKNRLQYFTEPVFIYAMTVLLL